MGFRERLLGTTYEAPHDQRILSDVLNALSDGNSRLLSRRNQRQLPEKVARIWVPSGQVIGVVPREFTIKEGMVFSQRGLVVATAVGYLQQDSNATLIGGVHVPDDLVRANIDYRSPKFFPSLIRALPGTHVDGENYLAFAMGRLSESGGFGLMFGDNNPDQRKNRCFTSEELLSNKNVVKNVLAQAVAAKYFPKN